MTSPVEPDSGPEEKFDDVIKMVLVGNTHVGKTTLVNRAVTGAFTENAEATLMASFCKKVVPMDDQMICLQIWDTAGQERYRSMTPLYYHKAEVALVVYAIDDRESFESVDSWMKSLKEHAAPNLAVFIAGNKTDRSDDRTVTPEQGEEKAREFEVEFAEVSARTGFGVDDLFALIPRVWATRRQSKADVSMELAPLGDGGADKSKSCC
jgi:small GTP-binding protein